jgi:hypothetical protein
MAVVPRRKENFAPGACLSSDAVGNLVYIRDVFNGTRYRVTSVDPSSSLKMPAIGVIVAKQTPTACTIMFYGFSALYSSLAPGGTYYVGLDSRPAQISDPNYPPVGSIIQQIGVATDDDELLIRPMDVQSSGSRVYQQLLISTIDPKVFISPMLFVHGVSDTEVVEYNGQRLLAGVGNDYTVSESGGPGSGYDTITLEFTLATVSNMLIDFVPDV